MFGINDGKSAGQADPIMPLPLESPEPEVSYSGQSPVSTQPPASGPPPQQPQAYPPVVHAPDSDTVDTSADELLKIKQKALTNLQPLVGKLDQTPEEKFKTTMMMLQASDNPELIRDAYATANAITDDKARAQALLDVVNEINYFTHHEAA